MSPCFSVPLLHQDGGDGAAAHVELRLDHRAFGGTVRVGLEFEDFGLQRDGFQQLSEALAGQGGDLDVLHVARHLLDDHLVLQKIGAHLVGVRVGLVDLVDRHDHRDLGGLGVIDGLDRLRHHRVVGGHHQDDDIRHLRATRAHRGEGGVAGRVEEVRAPRVGLHLVGADMLRDAAGLARDDIRLADRVQKRGLAVVDMAHDRDDRRTRLKILPCRRRSRSRPRRRNRTRG
jgi:hypothetical protein